MAYTQCLLDKVDGSRSIPGYIRRDVGLFAHLDRHFESPSSLTNARLAETLGPKELNRYRRASGYLVTCGLIDSLSAPDVEWALIIWRIRAIKEDLKSEWARTAFEAFYDHLLMRRALFIERGHRRTREPIAPTGIRCAMYGALHLLKTAERRGSIGVQDITQRDLQWLLSHSKIAVGRLGRFVSYLNTETPRFHKLKLPRTSGNPGLPEGVLGSEQYEALLRTLLRADAPADRSSVLASLICLLYGQPPKRTMHMKLDQVRCENGCWEVRFAKDWISLHPELSNRMATWMASRREISVVEATGTSRYLFPGRRAGSPMKTDTLHSWLAAHGVKPQQLQSSGIAQMVQSEDFHPSIAVEALGLTRFTVAKYMKLLAPTSQSRMRSLIP